MDLRQEYKKSAEIINPSAEALERMKRNILEKAAQPEKKAFPFKKLAYAGSALAACAVIAVGAAVVLPSLTAKNDMATAADAANSESAVYAVADSDKTAGFADAAAQQNTDACVEMYDGAVFGDAAMDSFAPGYANAVPEAEDCSVPDECDAPDTMAEAAEEESAALSENGFVIQNIMTHMTEVELVISDSGDTLTIGGISFTRTDDGTVPPDVTAASTVEALVHDGVTYRFDFYGEDYFVLTRDGACLGGYTRD